MSHDLDAVVVGVGSGGTLTGLGPLLQKGAAEHGDDSGRSDRLNFV